MTDHRHRCNDCRKVLRAKHMFVRHPLRPGRGGEKFDLVLLCHSSRMSNVFSRIGKAATPARIASGAAVLSPAIKPILGPGNVIGHVIEAIGKIAELVDKAKQNKDDIKHFHTFAEGQLSAITKAIEDAAPDRREVLQKQLAGALAVLSEVITTCEKLTAKNRAAATMDAASVSAELNGLQSRFIQAVSTFMMHAGIRTEAKVDSILDLELNNRLVKTLRPLIQATHNWGEAPEGCLENTRKELLAAIDTWVDNPRGPHTFWLSGLGGTGKTAATRSAAKRLAARKYRVASFFISRHQDDKAHNVHRVLYTLVYQLVKLDPVARATILGFLDSNPDLESVTLTDQVNGMLIKSLEAIPADKFNKLVILIDALDECSDVERLVGGGFLSSVINSLPSMSGRVKLFLTSRCEPLIQDALEFIWDRLRSEVKLHEFMPERTADDIRAYLQHSFNGIRDKHKLPAIWPSRMEVDELIRRSGAFFIYAATLVRHIEQARLSPQKRLANILAKAGAEGPPGERSPYAQVDDLYLEILRLFAGPEGEYGHTELCDHVRQTVAAVVLGHWPMSVSMISSILGLELEDVRTVVRGLGALWIVPATDDIPISLFHESFPEFILSKRRCTDARFQLSPDIGHCQIARGCLRVMNHLLKENICQIEYLPGEPLPAREQIAALKEQLDLHVPAHLKYSVEHWLDHFRSVQNIEGVTIMSDVAMHFSIFCDEKLLYWIETLCLLDQNGADALIASGRLLQEFLVAVRNFEEPLRRSHAEIYSFFLAFLLDGELSRNYSGHPRLIRVLTKPDSASSSSVYVSRGWDGVANVRTNSTGSIAACTLHDYPGGGLALLWANTSISTPTHRIPATDFALSPLGTTFALSQQLGNGNCAISVWSSNNTAPLARRAFNKQCLTLAFVPDGGRIICVFNDAIQLMDVNDLRDISGTRRRLEHKPSVARFLAGDSALVIDYRSDVTTTISTAADGWTPRTLPGLPRAYDHAEIIAMSADQSVTFINCVNRQYLVNSDPALGRLRISATAAALSSNGQFVARLSPSCKVTISRVAWHPQPQLADSRVLEQLDDGTDEVDIEFSPNGHHFLLSYFEEVAVWDVSTGECVFHQIREGKDQFLTLRFLGDLHLFHAVANRYKTIMLQVLPISSSSPEAPPRIENTQRIIAQSMCGIWVAIMDGETLDGETLTEAPTFSIWNLMSGAGVKIDTATFFDPEEYDRGYPGCSAASFVSDGSLVTLFKTGGAGLAIVFPSGIQGHDEVKTFRLNGARRNGRDRRFKGFVMSSLGDRVAVYDRDRRVFLWDTPGFTNRRKLEHRLDMIAFSPDGLFLAGMFNHRTVYIFSVEDNSFIHEIAFRTYCDRLSISRGFISVTSGHRYLSVDYDGVTLHETFPKDLNSELDEVFFETGGSQASHFTRRVIGVSPSRIWTVSGKTSIKGTAAWTAPSAQAYQWPSLAKVSDDGWLQVSFDTLTTGWEIDAENQELAYNPLCWLPPLRRPPSEESGATVHYIAWSGPRIIVIGESGIVTILDCSAHPLFQLPPATS
ncbi:hypothetical protein BKA62DRAFT_834131 [Auriculariales sp. MPI-PUGE-AT-0066]|nr:hypothetical protein BKA62DRAFT_834131 [Auriculariales sp. MPI-PUGE-AT-0066]